MVDLDRAPDAHGRCR